MVPKLKHAAFLTLVASLAVFNLPTAFAGGIESGVGDDISKQIEALKQQVNSLSSTVNELKQENTLVKAKSIEVETELNEIKGLQPGTQIAKSMDSRVTSLEDKVGTIKISGALTGIFLTTAGHRVTSATNTSAPNRAGPSGNEGQRNRSIGAGSFDLYLESKILENTRIYANLEANSANEPFNPSIAFPNGNPTFSTHLAANNIDVMNVLELYVESTFYNKALTVTVGKIDLTNYFDGNKIAWDEHRQFLAGEFLDNPTFASIVPFNTIGARAQWNIGWGLTAQIAGMKEANSGDKILNAWYGIGELDYQTFLFFGKEGNYRVYSYLKKVDTFNPNTGVTNPGETSNPMGIGFSVDQKLTDKLTAFSRFGWNQNALANTTSTLTGPNTAVRSAVSVGAQYAGLLPNRPDDILGGAWGAAQPSEPNSFTMTFPDRPDREYFMEFYYNYQIAKNFHVSPVLQFMLHPNGGDDENWTAIFGGRAFLEF